MQQPEERKPMEKEEDPANFTLTVEQVIFLIFGGILIILTFAPWASVPVLLGRTTANPLAFVIVWNDGFLSLFGGLAFLSMGVAVYNCIRIGVDEYTGRESAIAVGVFSLLSVGLFWMGILFQDPEFQEGVRILETVPLIVGISILMLILGFRE